MDQKSATNGSDMALNDTSDKSKLQRQQSKENVSSPSKQQQVGSPRFLMNKSRKEKKEPVSFNINGNIIATTQTIQPSPRKKFDVLNYRSGVAILDVYKEKYRNKVNETGLESAKCEAEVLKNNTSKVLNSDANNQAKSSQPSEEHVFYQPISNNNESSKREERCLNGIQEEDAKNENLETDSNNNDNLNASNVGKLKKIVFI